MRSFIYFLLAGAALHSQMDVWNMPKIYYVPTHHRHYKNRERTKAYADHHQKAKRNRPYYGHHNHKYIIPHKNRR